MTNKDYTQSMWKHFNEFTFNPQMKEDVINKFDRFKNYFDYGPLKQPASPMMIFDKKQLEKLRKLSKKYKQEFCKDGSDGGYFIDYTKYKFPKEKINNFKKATFAFQNQTDLTFSDKETTQEKRFEETEVTQSSKSSIVDFLENLPEQDINELIMIHEDKVENEKNRALIPKYFKRHILKDKKNFYYEKFLKILNQIESHNKSGTDSFMYNTSRTNTIHQRSVSTQPDAGKRVMSMKNAADSWNRK